jgi:hypothetical protein
MSSPDQLELFYAKIRGPIEVSTLLDEYKSIFPFIHRSGLTADYREARGRLKRLRDEVTPIVGLLKRKAEPTDMAKFNLDSSDYDALWVRSQSSIKIEATVAQARARLNLMRELNKKGEGRGFLPITDDEKTERFLAAMDKEPSGYLTKEYVSTLDRAIRLCLRNKQNSPADILVIDAPASNECFPFERLGELPVLCEPQALAQRMEIYVIDREVCLRIRGH